MNKKKTALGDRMKANYEDRYRIKLPRRTNIIIRVDGKAFHTYTRNMKKPFDDQLIEAMSYTAENLCKNIQGAQLAYMQSDEISILVTDYADINTDAWFDNNLQKMCSISASMSTGFFNQILEKTATFDSRVFVIPEYEEVKNYFIWRQQDYMRNSVSMLAQSMYSHKELQGLSVAKMIEKMSHDNVDWHNLENNKKYGYFYHRRDNFACETTPLFVEDRDALNLATTYSRDMKNALNECEQYARMGALDAEILKDIAHDHDVSVDDLSKAFYE